MGKAKYKQWVQARTPAFKEGLGGFKMEQKELNDKQKEFRKWLDETLPNPTSE